MRYLYFDCFSGISGDMVLGALIDLGIDAGTFKRELEKLNIDGYSINIKKTLKNGISCTDVDVILEEGHNHDDANHDHGADHHLKEDQHHEADQHELHHHEAHEHNVNEHEAHQHQVAVHHHEANHHEANHHEANHHHGAHRQQRNLLDIVKIIDQSDLGENVKNIAKRIFGKLAEAEAKVHGKPVDQIHFHEVGAVDSIVDIAGAAICIDMLKIDRFMASPVNTGMGFVECQHGIIPVPGPATAELLKNAVIYSLDIKTELVTPTGAAILSTLCQEYGPIPLMKEEMVGYGSGKKVIEKIPGLLRVFIGSDPIVQ